MNEHLMRVKPLNLDNLSAQIDGEGQLRLRGAISLRAPSDTLGPFFEQIHQAAVNDDLSELRIDVTELSFMNSSSIRVLITWLDWIAAEPVDKQYVLHFRTNTRATWQETTFSVLESLGEQHVRVTKL